jgi:hypothetical protein
MVTILNIFAAVSILVAFIVTFKRFSSSTKLSRASLLFAFLSTVGLWYINFKLEKQNDATISQLHSEIEAQHDRIVSAKAVIVAKLNWDVLGNSEHWKSVITGNTSYIAFVKQDQVILLIRSQNIVQESNVKGEVVFQTVCDLSAAESEVKGSIKDLRDAEFLQIRFPDTPNGTLVASVTIELTINGNQTIHFQLGKRNLSGDIMISHEIKPLKKL